MMKKFFSICVFFLMLGAVAFAQGAAKNAKEAVPADGPKMAFELETIDYGEIVQGSDPYRFFKFTNDGSAPLVITHAKGSCGCTIPTYPKEPIMPGGEGEIKVRYDTQRIGPFTKRVTLTTNMEGENKNVILTIKGVVNKKPSEPEGVPTNNNPFNNN